MPVEADQKPRTFAPVVVGIGTGSDCQDALIRFLQALGSDPGVAILVVRQADADQGDLVELLASSISLPVEPLTADGSLKPNRILVAPPNAQVAVLDDFRVRILESRKLSSRSAAIDGFLQSLADRLGANAVGIVLSGTEGDGALGLRAIRNAGGMTMAQADDAAGRQHASVSGIAQEGVDHLLPPERMPAELVAYCRHLQKLRRVPETERDWEQQVRSVLPCVCQIVRDATGHDFQNYKPNTLSRRLVRRMHLLRLNSGDAYLERLREDREEVDLLVREFLISVTSFFRDPDTFAALAEQVLPSIVAAGGARDSVRVWVPGCATGEEAYTLAILLQEERERAGLTVPLQVFATDIGERSLEVARAGVYSAAALERVSPERLERFFVRRNQQYQISGEIRDLCVFSSQNLVRDPPFAQIDLISCRNVLIYFDTHLQQRVLSSFHFALRPGGYLLLGPSESLAAHSDLFHQVDETHRIARRESVAANAPPYVARTPRGWTHRRGGPGQLPSAQTIPEIARRVLLDEFAPRYVIVNRDAHVVSTSNGVEQYLEFPDGEFHSHIVEMVRPGLRSGLRGLLRSVRESGQTATRDDLTMKTSEGMRQVAITIRPLSEPDAADDLLMVVFEERATGTIADILRDDAPADIRATIDQLEQELDDSRVELEETVRELERSNEDLRASNEELLAINEELHAANEELEASKEEIQSGMEAAAEARSDLENLLNGTKIATLFLDEHLNIKSFTPSVRQIFNVKAADLGRPLSDISHKARRMPIVPEPESLEDAEAAASEEIQLESGEWFVRRALPYSQNRRRGVILTFVEFTELKQAQLRLTTMNSVARLLATARSLREVDHQIVEIVRSALQADIGLLWRPEDDDRLHCETTSKGSESHELQAFLEVSNAATFASGEGLPGLAWQNRQPEWIDNVSANPGFVRSGTAAECGIASGIAMPILAGERCWGVLEFFTVRQLQRNSFLSELLTSVGNEIGSFLRRFEADEALRDQEARKSAVLEAALDCIVTMDVDGRIVDFNPAAEATFGWTASEVQGRPLADTLIAPRFRQPHRQGLARYLATQQSDILGRRLELTACRKDGEEFPVEVSIQATSGRHGRPFFTGYLRDITERQRAERILKDRARMANLHSALAVALSNSAPLDETLQTCCQNLVDHLDAAFARIWLLDQEGQTLELKASCGMYTHLDGGHARVPLGSLKIGRIASRSQPLMTNDVPNDPNIGDPDWAKREGMVAFAGYPLIVEERVVGVVALFARHELSPETFDQMQPMADGIAQCVARKRSEEQMRQNELELRENQLRLEAVLKESEEAKAKLQVLFDQSLYFAGMLDLDGTVREVNQTALVQCGYTYEQVIGKPYWETGWWSGSKDVQSTIREACLLAAQGQPFHRELPYWLEDGTERIVDFALTPVRSESGEILFLVPTGADITDRKKAEERERHEAEVQTFLSRAGAALMSSLDYHDTLSRVARFCVPRLGDWAFVDLIESDGEVRRLAVAHADPGQGDLAEALKKYPPRRDLRQHPPARALFGGEEMVIPEFTEAMIRNAAHNEEHEQIIRRIGPRSFLTVPLVARGIIFGALNLVMSDSKRSFGKRDLKLVEEVARRAAIAIDNARLYESAQRANLAKSEFLANMSHEIRTPMTAVLGYADLLATHEDDPQKLDFLRTIKRNGTFLVDIINDILDLSKIEAGKLEVTREPFAVHELVADVYSMMHVRAVEKHLRLRVDFETPVPERIESDPKRLRQILVNLIGNAIKFTEAGEVRLLVRYDDQIEPPRLEFDVIDTGVGITPEQQSRLFHPFSQGDAAVNRRFGGTGLGLAISQRLAAMLGGRITVRSEPGKGSTFSFFIEAPGADPAKRVQPTLEEESPEPLNGVSGYRLSCRVLVVDDRRDVRALTQRFLMEAGGEVDFAEDGLQAIERVQTALTRGPMYDLILLDMQMPRLDGYETAVRLRKMGYRRPIIALTADAMQGDMTRCLASGCDAYLSKPIDADNLLQMVDQYSRSSDGESSSAEADDAPSASDSVRVVVVDDSPDACKVMQRLLQIEGFDVETAADGTQAIAICRRFRPQIVLLDLTLPGMDGYETLDHLRAVPELQQTRFIALSGHSDDATRRRSGAAGFEQHLVKPVEVATLLKLLRRSNNQV